MQSILLENIINLGKIGDKVTVKNGYGRNFLLPGKKAIPANKENMEKYEAEKAQILAGGQSLISMLNMRIVNPEIIIDINFLKDVISLEKKDNTIEIGPLFRQLELENWSDLKSKLPLIYQSIPYVGQIQHRARGTVLGSICHGDPTSELPLCFLALIFFGQKR